jgi:radical SAM superfamily enzyme YgiQ (UPF0313 family)
MAARFRLTLVLPCIGRRVGERYLRTWQMEPLPLATLAARTPPDVEVALHDDRMEAIPFDRPTDLVAISVETYTARRAYEIASEYRRRRVPVVMGGFHASLCPDEVARYADSVVVGEAEELWPRVIDDYRAGTPRRRYRQDRRSALVGVRPDRRVYGDRRYLPVSLVEVGRGCEFGCEFCSIQSVFQRSYRRRPVGEVVAELTELRARRAPRLVFFVDDNFVAHPEEAREVLEAITPLGLRWVSQASINVAHDEELLRLLRRSGCAGLLIGFESLDPDNLARMGKQLNLARGGFAPALAALRRHRIPLYVTFLFGYDHDTPASLDRTVAFARDHGFYMAAFNHVTPFPGTPLYARLAAEGRLRFDRWWLDPAYSYNTIPFQPARMSPEGLHQACLQARRSFFSLGSIAARSLDPANRADLAMLAAFFPINLMHLVEIGKRDHHPLGDRGFGGPLLEVA